MPADLYSQHAEVIEAALAYAQRAHRLSADAADEFASWARLKLLDNDCAILRKFQGRSSLRTFLITVVQRLFLDWRNAEWGKWRPTADARRGGRLAIELERLIVRDQLPFGEAVEVLVSRGLANSRAECDRTWAELPQRPGRKMAEESLLAQVAAPGLASDQVMARERREQADAASAAMAKALAALSPQDQVIVRLRFQEGFTVARIALMVGEDQKALYRRFDRLLTGLREAIVAHGISASDAADLLAHPTGELQSVFGGEMGHGKTGPSKTASTGGEHG